MVSSAPQSSNKDFAGKDLSPSDASAIGFADSTVASNAGANSGGTAPSAGATREL